MAEISVERTTRVYPFCVKFLGHDGNRKKPRKFRMPRYSCVQRPFSTLTECNAVRRILAQAFNEFLHFPVVLSNQEPDSS